VYALVRQAKAETHRVHTQGVQQKSGDGDASPGTHQVWLATVELAEDLACHGQIGILRRDQVRSGTVFGRVDARLYTGRSVASDVLLDCCCDLRGILVGHQAAGDLGMGHRRNHGLGACARKPAPQAIDFQRGSSPGAFQRGVARLAKERTHTQLAHIGLLIEWHRGDSLPLLRGERGHVLVETAHRNATISAVHRIQQPHECVERVLDGAAIGARMDVMIRAAYLDLHATDAS